MRKIVADTDFVVNAQCPIDHTTLVHSGRYELDHYECLGCGAVYQDLDTHSIQQSARNYAAGISKELADKKADIARLEQVVAAAKRNKILLND